jgi:hypothetical protein
MQAGAGVIAQRYLAAATVWESLALRIDLLSNVKGIIAGSALSSSQGQV